MGIFSKTRHWHGSAPAYSLVHQRNRQALGHVGIVVRTVMAGGTPVKVAGIQNLAVRPNRRGTGLGAKLIAAAMDEARRRGISQGLLFCAPTLEKFYKALGWATVPASVIMLDEQGRRVPIPGKNICMVKPLSVTPFPPGVIDLHGADW
jgi:predicted N-acetyltransferase YhbS